VLLGHRVERRGLDVGLGELLADDVRCALLVLLGDVGVQEADRDGVDALLAELAGGRPDLVLVEREHLRAVPPDALGDSVAVLPLDDRPGLVRAEPAGVVELRAELAVLAPDVEQVAVACRREEGDPRARAAEHGVDTAGVPVDDLAHLFDRDPRLVQGGDHALLEVGLRGEHLVLPRLTGLPVDAHDIGERPTHVDAEPPDPSSRCVNHRPSTPSAVRRCHGEAGTVMPIVMHVVSSTGRTD
jgi:hypothetical protein